MLTMPLRKIIVGLSIFTIMCLGVAGYAAAQETVTVMEDESGFYYTIKKGDTLWDLSQQFMDTPWQWPDLWKENAQIRNPHWIYPGQRIQLYRKEGAVTAPAPEPPSFYYPPIDSVGFITEERTPASGHIIEFKGPGNIDRELDNVVYIKAEPGRELTPGQTYTIYRVNLIKNPENYRRIGFQHYITGLLEVFKKEEQFYRAKIIRVWREIEVGDFVMPYVPSDPRVMLTDSVADIKGKILLSEDDELAFGDFDLAFIDKGSNDGIALGQSYRLYRIKEAEGIAIDIDVGSCLVLDAQMTTATVLLTQTDVDIRKGYRFRSPE